jgi:hypothetical protein
MPRNVIVSEYNINLTSGQQARKLYIVN